MITNIEKIEKIDDVIEMNDSALFTVVGTSAENIEKLETAPYSYWKSVWKQLRKNKVAIICLVLIVLVVLLTIFGPMIRSYPYYDIDRSIADLAPSSKYWFGTNNSGRDIWTLIWVGSRFSLLVAAVSSVINIFIGLVIGGLWGYIRKLDPILIEITNVVNNIPSLLIYILIMKILKPGFWTMVFVLCLFGWMGLAALMRNQIIIIRNREFNIASETLGSSAINIITHNLLPNLVSIIVQVISGFVPACIGMEVSLKFYGVMPATIRTLGITLNEGASSDFITHPHELWFPAGVLMIITIAFFYFGLATADACDPKTHR